MRNFIAITAYVFTGLFISTLSSGLSYSAPIIDEIGPKFFAVLLIFSTVPLTMGLLIRKAEQRKKDLGLLLLWAGGMTLLSNLSLLAILYDDKLKDMMLQMPDGAQSIALLESLKLSIAIPLSLALTLLGFIFYKSSKQKAAQ